MKKITYKIYSARQHKKIYGNTVDFIKFIEKYIEQPRHDLRGTGIISGCQVFNIIDGNDFADFKKFDISGGVAIVNGIRFTINPISEIKIYPTQDFYVAINKYLHFHSHKDIFQYKCIYQSCFRHLILQYCQVPYFYKPLLFR